MSTSFRSFGMAVALAWVTAQSVRATPINIDTGKVLSMGAGANSSLVLSATNTNSGTSVTNFNGWTLGLQLLPQGGATGTVTMTGITNPATNQALTVPDTPTFFNSTLNTATNGTTAYKYVGISNVDNTTTTFALGQSLNLANLAVTSSAGAAGTWNLYAVNQSPSQSAWLDVTGLGTDYGNLPATNGTSVLVGTVTVVPEPGSLLLAGLSGVALCAAFGRRQSMRASLPA
jgi:hypothetical protein